MDAKERLRLYLEQRRETGESELVLDSMSVDDVLSLVGASSKAKPPRTAAPPASAMVPPAPRMASPDGDNPRVGAHDVAAAPSAPPAPAPRFDDQRPVGSDWRATLRQADSGQAPDTAPAGVPSAGGSAVLPPWLAALQLPAGLTAGNEASLRAAAHDIAGLSDATSLDQMADLIRACTRCTLHASARNPVPGVGNPSAELVCVGEAPGANEDELGEPFVGEAGQLLTKILAAIDLTRESVFICNVLKHRPPGNRDPLPEEVTACQPFLHRQLLTIRPRVIVALGRFAAQTLLGTTVSLGKLREQVHLYHGIPVVVTYHPAALLRNVAWKRPTWSDVKLARRILDASRVASPATPGPGPDGKSDATPL